MARRKFHCPRCQGSFETIRFYEIGVDQSTPVSFDKDDRLVQIRQERTVYSKNRAYYQCPHCLFEGSLKEFAPRVFV